jgi:hypothetical protein
LLTLAYFDDSVRGLEDVERYVGLRVIGAIPRPKRRQRRVRELAAAGVAAAPSQVARAAMRTERG